MVITVKVQDSTTTRAGIRAALSAHLEHCTPALIGFRSEGHELWTVAEVADLGGGMVAIFSFDIGMLVSLWVGQVTHVEAWEAEAA